MTLAAEFAGAQQDQFNIGGSRPPAVSVEAVTVRFRTRKGSVEALAPVDIQIPDKQFVAIVGPSGCGKTTILNMLAGLLKPSSGRVLRDGRPVTGPTRDVGYMLARSALTPWRTVRRNVELGPELRGVPRAQRRGKAMELLASVGIAEFADHYPEQLSHGMQQRVAVARTLAVDPSLWLMDEPFGALDAQTRLAVQTEFLRLWERDQRTVILVTHDLAEAVLMADRVIVMSPRPGSVKLDRLIELARPRDLEQLRFDPNFMRIEREIWAHLKERHG